jgi:Zn-dependent metalloprotease
VNAATGAIERSVSELRRQAPVIGKGTGVLRDSKKVSARQATGTFQAWDLLRPASFLTLTLQGSPKRLNDLLETGFLFESDIATSSNNVWTDGATVDAHAYQGWVYDYYFKRFGRRGLDDRDGGVLSIVHPLARSLASQYPPEVVGVFINNALYIHPGLLIFGDGDGQVFDYLAGSLDVVAHEMTHGVTAFTSNLEYLDESGALNEAFSDIMAVGHEFHFLQSGRGPQKGPNFLIGEDVTRFGPGYLRSLEHPGSVGDPDHYSLRQHIGTDVDYGGVHFNSTIAGHAFYLAIAGGRNRTSGISVQGVGLASIERIERIFYRAFVFLMAPRAEFADARAATLQAATDLYGPNSVERSQVAQAWTAVGVG